MIYSDTIVAVATPKGVGALAVLRLSGTDARKIFALTVQEQSKAETVVPSALRLYTLFDGDGSVIDEVTASVFEAPRSFTGEQMVEIICHGGTIIVERIVGRFVALGLRYAGRGEFTRRAFLNGKVDLRKAEAINQIIHAETQAMHKTAMRQYLGADRHFFDAIRGEIESVLVLLETDIEFSETDDVTDAEQLQKALSFLLTKIHNDFTAELKKRSRLKMINQGISVVLAGRANAGKSSLLNMIVGYDRAIINSRAGTTRDLITETRVFEGIPLRFVDSAGLNQSDDEIEQEGIRRTIQAIHESEIVCWVVSADEVFCKEDYEIIKDTPFVLGIMHKEDCGENTEALQFWAQKNIPVCSLSSTAHTGLDGFFEKMSAIVLEHFSEIEYETVIGSDREESIVRKMLGVVDDVDVHDMAEMVAESLRELLSLLAEIYGYISPDDIMNKGFDAFCIGK